MMTREIRVMIVEDDPYARDLMALLLRRDWRTQVIWEVGETGSLAADLAENPVDLVLLDTEHPDHLEWARTVLKEIHAGARMPRVLCTGTRPSAAVLKSLDDPSYCGYLVKGEIGYSLAWAVVLAAGSEWVVSPAVEVLAGKIDFMFPKMPVVLKGQPRMFGLSEAEIEVARLGILFNLPRNNLADELNRSPYTIYEYIHKAYEKMGLQEMIDDAVTPQQYFAGDEEILHYFKDSLELLWQVTRHKKDMDTLAFTLLTIPELC
jgi:DNA-binding NarL/FixJ family response regulator